MPDSLPPLPASGRVYSTERRVRQADVSPTGRLRLDAVARYLQDIATDDVVAAGLDEPAWVVRRTRIVADGFPVHHDRVAVRTYCWSLGSRYAERRTTVRGLDGAGGAIDTLTLWVKIDPQEGRPTALTQQFRELYEEAVEGRRTNPKLHLAAEPDAMSERTDWPLRGADFDVLGHVNNAVTWTALEEGLTAMDAATAVDAEMEFRAPVPPGARVVRATAERPEGAWTWLVAGAEPHAVGVLWRR